MQNRIVNIDMDGVVADFDAFVYENLGRTFQHQAGPGGDREMWSFLASVPNLYRILKPTSYAFELVDMVKASGLRYRFLTAIPRRTSIPSAEQDKRDWVQQYFPGVEINIGPYSGDKWKWANAGDILIDDRADNILDWSTKGSGIGILHDYNDFALTREKFTSAVS